MPAVQPDLKKFNATPPAIGGYPAPTITPPPIKPAASTDPAARLSINNPAGLPATGGITDRRVLPEALGGTPITPTAIPPARPIRTINSAVTATTPPPPTIPQVPVSTTSSNSLGASLAAFGAGLQTLSESMAAEKAAKQSAADAGGGDTAKPGSLGSVLKDYLSLNTLLGNKGKRTEEINAEQELDEKQRRVNQISNQYSSRERYYDNEVKRVQSENPEGKSAYAIQQEVDKLTRDKNSELADIAIQYSAANGDLKTASDIAERKINAEFEPLQDQIDNLKSYYTLAQNDLSESEKLDAQAKIKERQDSLDEAKEKRLIAYRAQISEQYGGGSGSGTESERAASSVAKLQSLLTSNTPLANGNTPVDENGYLTPEAWKALIAQAPSEGLSRDQFIKSFGTYLYNDEKGGIPSTYGLTPAEKKVVLGELPASQ